MNFTSIGDLAQSLQMRRQSSVIKTNLDTYATELATGQHADIGRELNGNMRILSGIEASINTLTSYQRMAAHAERHLQDTQTALDVVQTNVDQASSDFLVVSNVQDSTLLNNASKDAKVKLATIVGALNTQSAGQSIFAGQDTDQNALQSADLIIQDLVAITSGLTTSGDVIAAIEDWFMVTGGGFETTSFTGTDEELGPLQVSETQFADISVSALSPAIRDSLKGLAAATLVDLDVPSGDYVDKKALMEFAAETLLSNASNLSALRGQIGLEQARVETAQSSNQSHISTLEIGRNDLILADPFETATQLENARNQLETLYSVTARLSQLKLADFLR